MESNPSLYSESMNEEVVEVNETTTESRNKNISTSSSISNKTPLVSPQTTLDKQKSAKGEPKAKTSSSKL